MREGTGKRFVGLDISLRCIYKPSLAGNGSYISVAGNISNEIGYTK